MQTEAEPAKRLGKGHSAGVLLWLYNVQLLVFQTKKQAHRAVLHLGVPKLASCNPWCRDKEHIIYKLRAIAAQLLFSSVNDSQVGCVGWTPQRSGVANMVRA